MNMKRNTVWAPVFATLLLGLAAMNCVAQADDAAKKDLANKVEAAAAAIKNYSVAQKDEAINSAKATLEDFDTRIQTHGRASGPTVESDGPSGARYRP